MCVCVCVELSKAVFFYSSFSEAFFFFLDNFGRESIFIKRDGSSNCR